MTNLASHSERNPPSRMDRGSMPARVSFPNEIRRLRRSAGRIRRLHPLPDLFTVHTRFGEEVERLVEGPSVGDEFGDLPDHASFLAYLDPFPEDLLAVFHELRSPTVFNRYVDI